MPVTQRPPWTTKFAVRRSQSLSSYVAVSPAGDIRCAVSAARGYGSCQVPNSGAIVAIVDDDKAVGNAIEVLMRSMGLVAQAFSSADECAHPN
jgi:hypothetical protein